MARSLTTTDHDTIRKWAEERGGKPSEVASTARGDDVGIIRVDFPGFSGEGKLQEITWDDWFKKFDEASLAFVYEEETADGQRSNFNKLVGRETAEKRAEGVKTNRRALRSGSAKAGRSAEAGRSGTSRQAARMEAGRTTRAKRSSGGASSSGRGSAASRKKTTGRKASASGRATTGRSSSRSASARSASTRSTSGRSSGGGARKAGRSSARKSR